MIQLSNVSKKYGSKTVLHNISFSLPAGEITGVVGPNGAGKSTLLKCIATMMPPTSGLIVIDGMNAASDPRAVRPLLGYVPQEIAVYQELTVKQNIEFFAKLAGRRDLRAVLTRCEEWQLMPHYRKKVKHLSGGNQRKLNILVALLHEPDLLILDEPTVGIDIAAKQEIVSHLKQLAYEGKTILYSSHDAQELQMLCDSYLIMKEGELLFHGPKEKLRQHVPSPYNQSFTESLAHVGAWGSRR
ncbi:ABC transporter ATP-binding protein [Fictibacillus iocasae]|uniref:ABC transporter ATP-binding protein n=1 Tax=Fictibacillus iocasae TaxID=2715437 RepID=A0ABW2NP46_9BACL